VSFGTTTGSGLRFLSPVKVSGSDPVTIRELGILFDMPLNPAGFSVQGM